MLDLFHISKPQGCDIQTFYGLESPSGTGYYRNTRTWSKPRGVSHIYMLLIGSGGYGDGVTGGGSGAVTVWYGAAQHVPDNLTLVIGGPGSNAGHTAIYYRGTEVPSSTNFLLKAEGGAITNAGAAMTANQFAASGFFNSVAGQNGIAGNQTQSSTTFLSGGSASGPVTSNYGYRHTAPSNSGFFQMQPIIVGSGGISDKDGGVGCGSGGNVGALGGPGMVLIASW